MRDCGRAQSVPPFVRNLSTLAPARGGHCERKLGSHPGGLSPRIDLQENYAEEPITLPPSQGQFNSRRSAVDPISRSPLQSKIVHLHREGPCRFSSLTLCPEKSRSSIHWKTTWSACTPAGRRFTTTATLAISAPSSWWTHCGVF